MDEIANAGAYDEKTAQNLYGQVLEGISYLHEKGVCHRDIKPSNILVTKDRLRVYLADFNVANKRPDNYDPKTEFKMYTRSAGTLAYVAPERLAGVQEYTEKVDMWAAGLVLYMLLKGTHPFELDEGMPKLMSDILNGE